MKTARIIAAICSVIVLYSCNPEGNPAGQSISPERENGYRAAPDDGAAGDTIPATPESQQQ